jgi:hypothetical protein
MSVAPARAIALATAAFLVSSALAQPGAAQAGIAALEPAASTSLLGEIAASAEPSALLHTRRRLGDDFAAMSRFRPGYAFWQHIFTIPDGSVVFGSGVDGRVLAVFPTRGNWTREADWAEPGLAGLLEGQRLASSLTQRRQQVESLLESSVGRVLHNESRGLFLLPNVERYGSFLSDWGAIFERFGVPAEIGLAQAMIESGLNGRVRSEAEALGFCQWLPENWERLSRLAHHTIEGYNQTTQAAYCAAYLSILAIKYGSFIPALSEHHAGGTNVGRTVINGGRLGAQEIREQYLRGSQLALDLREMSPADYRRLYGTYGPRSFRYAEMVFGNAATVGELTSTIPQRQIYAMRARRAIPLAEITRRTGLSAEEVRRFNPALVNRVPAGADLYLPSYVEDFGPDVSFWHRPADPGYSAVLEELVNLNATLEEWNDPAFRSVLRDFQQRFEDGETEEGKVMATVLDYVTGEMYSRRRLEILADYESDADLLELFRRGAHERDTLRRFETIRESVTPEVIDAPAVGLQVPDCIIQAAD